MESLTCHTQPPLVAPAGTSALSKSTVCSSGAQDTTCTDSSTSPDPWLFLGFWSGPLTAKVPCALGPLTKIKAYHTLTSEPSLQKDADIAALAKLWGCNPAFRARFFYYYFFKFFKESFATTNRILNYAINSSTPNPASLPEQMSSEISCLLLTGIIINALLGSTTAC